MIGAHYGHCLNYAHAHGLISSRLTKDPTPDQRQRFLALLAKPPSSIHHCAHVVGISVSVGYRIATAHGYHRKRSRTQNNASTKQICVWTISDCVLAHYLGVMQLQLSVCPGAVPRTLTRA